MDVRPDQPSPEAAPAAPTAPQPLGGGRRPWRTALEMLGLGPPPPDGHRFHALISYSHASDSRLATALQRGLQRFARPWYRTRALHVFRDNASLAANPHLWRSVQAGLDDSQHFILLASRDAAESPWVARECAYWRETKSIDRLLIVLTDGEIAWNEAAGDFDRAGTTALPGPLFGAFAGEPRWIDLRWAAADRDLTLENPRFREAIAELGAPLHGLPRDEFDSIEVRERRRAVRLARGATAALALLLVAAVVAAILALQARDEANRQSHVAQSRALAVQALDQFGTAGALTTPRPDLGVLLALEAYGLAPTEQARGAVLGALEATDRIAGYLHSAGGPIQGLAYSPDGKTIAIETGDRGIELWSARTLRRTAVLPPPRDTLDIVRGGSALAFSPDGKMLALAGVQRYGIERHPTATVAVWSVRTRHLLGKPLSLSGAVASGVAFAPSGGLLVAYLDGAVRIWNAARGKMLGLLPVSCAASGHTLSGIDVSATATVVVGCGDGSAWVWRATAPSTDPARLAPPPGADAARVSISPDGATIVVGYGNGELDAWAFDVTSSSYRAVGGSPSLGDGPVEVIKAAPDRRFQAVGYADGRLLVWTPAGETPVWSYESTPIVLYGVSWSRDGRTLAAGGDDGLGVLWRAPRARGAQPPPGLSTVLDAGASGGGPVAFDPDGRYLAVAEQDGIELWDPRRVRRLGTAPGSAAAERIALAPNTAAAVTTSAGSPVLRIWDTSDPGAPRLAGAPLSTRASIVNGVALDASGQTLAAAVTLRDKQSGVELWDLASRRMRFVRTAQDAYSVSFAPHQRLVAVGEGAGVVQTIDYAAAAPRPRTQVASAPTEGAVLSIAHSADGGMIAETGSGVVRLLDARTGALIGTPFRGSGPSAVSFSPDGTLLAIADLRGRVQLISAAGEEPFGRPLPALGSPAAESSALIPVIRDAAFSSDGALLAAGGSGPVTLWNRLLWTSAGYPQRRDRLCGLVGRNLTRLEWRTFLPGQPYRRTCPRWPPGT